MLENTVDLAGYDILWRNKPELPVANEENRRIEEKLKSKKLEIERLKVSLESNISKGRNMREHINDLCQTLSYKQQLYKTREHELEMETHSEKLLERECSRLEQEMKAMTNEINTLKERQEQRQLQISEQNQKRSSLKSTIQWDESALLQYLAKSAEMEKDNMALLKYTSEDDSKIHELTLLVEKLSQEAYEKKNALEDANTEVLIVQAELDRIQEEFRNAYNDRNNLINNWEKVINQIQHRSTEVNELSEYIKKMQDEQAALNHILKEQKDLLAIETARNDDIDRSNREKEKVSSQLKNECKIALEREENLKAQLSTIRNIMSNMLYQKQKIENNLRQLEKQLDNRATK